MNKKPGYKSNSLWKTKSITKESLKRKILPKDENKLPQQQKRVEKNFLHANGRNTCVIN